MAESRDVKRFKRFNNQLSKTNDLPIGDLEICSASAKTPITSTIKLASYNLQLASCKLQVTTKHITSTIKAARRLKVDVASYLSIKQL